MMVFCTSCANLVGDIWLLLLHFITSKVYLPETPNKYQWHAKKDPYKPVCRGVERRLTANAQASTGYDSSTILFRKWTCRM